VWVQAADNPRFLPCLAKWLACEGWSKAPPQARMRQGNGLATAKGARGRYRNGRKVDLAKLALGLGGYTETDDGRMVWGGQQ
jgi:hypothetical protein